MTSASNVPVQVLSAAKYDKESKRELRQARSSEYNPVGRVLRYERGMLGGRIVPVPPVVVEGKLGVAQASKLGLGNEASQVGVVVARRRAVVRRLRLQRAIAAHRKVKTRAQTSTRAPRRATTPNRLC